MKRLFLILDIFVLSFSAAFAEHVEPLLEGWVRQQDAPFNRYCPIYINEGVSTGRHCQVGCVATALESIISYHQRPIVLQKALEEWSSSTFKTETLPAGTTVDTRLILPDYGDGTAASVGMTEEDYEASVDAVARLSLMCGMAAKMNWGLGASGAEISDLVEPLREVFGWKMVDCIDSYYYTPEKWREILKEELRNGRPVLYTGYTVNMDGHAFVIDGFDEEDRFHVNWGYGGSYDGHYYDITQLCAFANPLDTRTEDVPQGFFCNQMALILSPDEVVNLHVADSLERTGYEIEIENIVVGESAKTNKYTPITITLRNTADVALCSPFVAFTNKTTEPDASAIENGDYGAIFGVNLAPGERTTITINGKFTKKGVRRLCFTPDDVALLKTVNMVVQDGNASDNLTFGTPSVEFSASATQPGLTDATFSYSLRNEGTERAGSMVTYGLMPETEVVDGDWRHYYYCYTPAGTTEQKSICFKGLQPGTSHLFIIRQPWTIRQRYTIDVPTITPVESNTTLTLSPLDDDKSCYDLSGRHLSRPASGIVVHGGRKQLIR